MVMSGVFTCLFGLGFYLNIHSLGYYAAIQVNTQVTSDLTSDTLADRRVGSSRTQTGM